MEHCGAHVEVGGGGGSTNCLMLGYEFGYVKKGTSCLGYKWFLLWVREHK